MLYLISAMDLKPLEVFTKGLNILQTHVKAEKADFQALLAENKTILSQDEKWLDHEANLG